MPLNCIDDSVPIVLVEFFVFGDQHYFGSTLAPGRHHNGFCRRPTLLHVSLAAGIWPLDAVLPAPENDAVYNAISWDDPDIHELARSIKEHGVQEPLLVSRDGYLISGHRRRVAAYIAGLTQVPVRVHSVSRIENKEEFLKLLVEMNSQRIKSSSVLLHETLIKINPKEAHERIVNQRKEKEEERSENSLTAIDPWDDGARCQISKAKQPFLEAILRVLDEQREYWPLSDRQIHYRLLGPDAPLRHASKPSSHYINDQTSYRSLTDLLARGRIDGLIPWEAIEDVTRPTVPLLELRQVLPSTIQ